MAEGGAQQVVAGRRHIIRRPRLTRLLDECEARVILLVAPAGYGKTTLAREWLEESRRPLWVWMRRESADVAAIAASVAAAVSTLLPGAGRGLAARLRATAGPRAAPELLADLLAADLQPWPSEAWLALEDYHHLAESPDAESFVDHLVRTTDVNVLVTSRVRPTWATPRRLLYGEFFELGASSLAMDADEARAVLAQREQGALPGLVALAEGWPAVIGLAALGRGERTPTEEIPRELHDFFAEEIFLGLSETAQDGLAVLAVAPTITDQVASTVLGVHATATLDEAVVAGFLTRREDGYEFHPLLREFMTRRASPSAEPEALQKLVELHLDRAEWDDAFAVVVTAGDARLAEKVIECALDDLLNRGRIETLQTWKERAPAGLEAAVLELVEAELAFRHARHERALVLAKRATSSLPDDHPLRPRAFLCAGQAAYFSDQTSEGREYSERAAELARSRRERASALWLRFTASTELEDPALAGVLADFERARTDDPDNVVRAACGHLIIDIRFGQEPHARRIAEGARALIDRVADPIVRTSFLNLLGRSNVLHAAYDEAVECFKACEKVATETRLDFALPHLLMAYALAELGRGRRTRAAELLRRGEQYAKDPHTRGNGRLVRARLLMGDGRHKEARALLAHFREHVSDRATLAELYAYRGLAAAVSSDVAEAGDLATRARETSRTIEPNLIANFVSAIVDDESDSQYLKAALEQVASSGHVDLMRLPLQCSSHLGDLIAASPAMEALAQHAVLTVNASGSRSPIDNLSPREREVLALVAEGLSNREIAGRLFISDVTVKVHVRHIFEKLGVHSRTEAVVVALDHSR
jgi:LuxR family maltose regulon positive regulatory protein